MSSNLRAFAQVPSTSRYLEVVRQAAAAAPTTPSDMAAFTIAAADLTTVGDIVVENSSSQLTGKGTTITVTSVDLTAVGALGTLYKDLGRQILIVDTSRRHVALFRQVQLVDGVGTDGVNGVAGIWNSNTFVKVWAADSTDIVVARTGPGSP